MNLIDAQSEMMLNIEAGNATMLSSGSGLGKSSVIKQTFDKIAAKAAPGEWGLGIVFAATMSPIDNMGVPFKGEHEFELPDGSVKKISVTDPTVPLWMISTEGKPAFCYKHFMLFIDEYGQGEADTKRGLSEILLAGGTGFWRLPDGNVRVAATNVGSRYGVTKDFDFAIARRTIVQIEGNPEVTLKYMDKPYMWNGRAWQTLSVVKAWAAQHPEILFEAEPKEQGPWCNPRTLCAADRYLQCKQAANGGKLLSGNPSQDSILTEMLSGTIGMPATTSLMAHLQFQLELPAYADVVKDPKGTEVPTKADLQMLMAYELAGHCKAPDLAPVLQYVSRLPKDMCVTFVQALLRRDYKGIINEPAMQAWINKNASLVSIISSLSQV